MDEHPDFVKARMEMVRLQLAGRNITDARLLAVMEKMPRHFFVPQKFWGASYDDGPLPIGCDQTISQPYIVALMTQLLMLKGHEDVLEIGTGSGYQAGILSQLAAQVYSLERHEQLAENARMVLDMLGIENVTVLTMDGSSGLPEHAPYDAIIVTAAAPGVPRVLAQQLADGGRLVIPVGGEGQQRLQLFVRQGERYRRRQIVPVAFVPLRGEKGWSEDEWETGLDR
jgi:protein-L-isoaspartate(D-aspartate) O-methyltransferase